MPRSNQWPIFSLVDDDGAVLGANSDNILLADLVAASANGNSPDQKTNARGGHISINITAIAGTGATLTVFVEAKDPVSGKYYLLLQSAGLTVVDTTVLKIYPGLVAAANLVANDILPKTWRVRWTITGTTPSVTAKIGASLNG